MAEYIERDEMPHKKKSQAKPPKKSKHKHQYEPCVLEFNGLRISKEHGIVYDRPEARISAYCPVCGKLGPLENPERWFYDRWITHPVFHRVIEPCKTEECERELNPETRTLPTFWVDDPYFTKSVEVADA